MWDEIMLRRFLYLLTFLLSLQNVTVADEYPRDVVKVRYRCSHDDTQQPALFFKPTSSDSRAPLVIALHTWSGDWQQTLHTDVAEWCVRKRWVFMHPDFRGPNTNPRACGSEAAVADIVDAVAWAKTQANVDNKRVYLIGTSGGGYMALLMAGRTPELWTAVSAWVPIVDLAQWHADCVRLQEPYNVDLENVCGGPPGKNADVDRQYRKRSPLTYLRENQNVAIDINAGIRDGFEGSVPVAHALRAFNQLAQVDDRIADDVVQQLGAQPTLPTHFVDKRLVDATYGKKRPLFRRTSGRLRVTLFDGGHELVSNAALQWLEKQRR